LIARYFDDGDSIGPEGLELLHAVLVGLCQVRDIDTDSAEAQKLAVVLVDLFKSGFRSRAELLFMTGTE
jgi:hypothetical protein